MEKENVLDVLAQRFCATRLPESVAADLCASQPGPGRYGTNLLTVAQARQMLGQVLAEVLDEEWFEQVLTDSLDYDWSTRDGARAIMRALALPTSEEAKKIAAEWYSEEAPHIDPLTAAIRRGRALERDSREG
ncbi:hypothetical protein [Sphingomonas sp. UMB7805-LC452B]|nr:hypothetical protein [Sphingomonas sp. UMB7805-LC452B]